MSSNLIKNLNDQQLTAILNTEGPSIIIAGAGVGKTRVLTHKIAYLVKVLKVASDKILALTFTNKAAKEMQLRIAKLITSDDDRLITRFNIATYHSFCAKVLRNDIHNLGISNNFNIIDTEDKRKILRDIYDKTFNEKQDIGELRLIASCISQWKNEHITKEEIISDNFEDKAWVLRAKVYEKYLQYQKDNSCIDFDDLLLLVKQLFAKFPDILAKWQTKFDYVLVDEFQDTNDLQYAILTKLVMKHQNLTVVGDPDQTIYTWRGANISLILKFNQKYPSAQTFILNQNYRSTHKILSVANSLIKNNQQRIKKDLYTLNNEGSNIVVVHAQNSVQEASWVAKKIKEMIIKKQEKLNNIAILYRNNYLSKDIEQALINTNLNYKIIGGFKFYERKEIKDILAYLKIIAWNDNLSMMRILAMVPKIGIKTIDNFLNAANTQNLTIFAYLEQNENDLNKNQKLILSPILEQLRKLKKNSQTISSLYNFTSLLLQTTKYLERLNQNLEYERVENIQQLLAQMLEYDTSNENLQGTNLLTTFLQEVSLYTDIDEDNKVDAVSLMTIHSAKGLEFAVVFIIGINEGILPGIKEKDNGTVNEKIIIEEERRLFYVAITRAKVSLFLSSAAGFSYVLNQYSAPSRFFKELEPSKYLQVIKVNELHNPALINNIRVIKSHNNTITTISNQHKNNWKIGDHLVHQIFGNGIVTKIIGDKIEIAFKKQHGTFKILSASHPSIKKVDQ